VVGSKDFIDMNFNTVGLEYRIEADGRGFRKKEETKYLTPVSETNNHHKSGGAKDCGQIMNMLVIDHTGTFYKYWYIFISICNITSSYNYCFYAAFRDEGIYDWLSGNFYEVFFFVDIIIHFLLDFKTSPTAQSNVREI